MMQAGEDVQVCDIAMSIRRGSADKVFIKDRLHIAAIYLAVANIAAHRKS